MKKIINKIKEWFMSNKESVIIWLAETVGGFCFASGIFVIVSCVYGMITKQKLRWSK